MKYSTRELLTLLGCVALLLHLFSCLLGMTASQMKPLRTTEFMTLVETEIQVPSRATPPVPCQPYPEIQSSRFARRRALSFLSSLSVYTSSSSSLTSYPFPALQNNPDCYGCIRGDPIFKKYCDTGCYTPCELELLVDLDRCVVASHTYKHARGCLSHARIHQFARARLVCMRRYMGRPVGLADLSFAHLLSPSGSGRPTAFGLERERYLSYLKSQESWICKQNEKGQLGEMPSDNGQVYIAGLYVALLQMSGGVGQIVPTNVAEYLVFLVCIAMGSVMWALVVGTICGISATGNPFSMAFKHNMDALNYFLEDMAMPTQLRHRAREYLRNSKELPW